MSGKAIVLDANILIRAVLGKRVRELIFDNASAVKFFAPDVVYADARKYLPALLKNAVWMPVRQCLCWISLSLLFSPLMPNSMRECSSKHYSASPFVMRTTGLYWRAQ